jgi:threonyl-tRNA synthetase
MATADSSLRHYMVQQYSLCYFIFQLVLFMQDDAHIFCLEDQIKDEIRGVLDLTEQILGQFGFQNYEINLSTRPEKSVGNDDIWEKAMIALKEALEDKGWEYKVDEGGGAFYGPKIDLKIEDALGRKWQCSTVQVSCICISDDDK